MNNELNRKRDALGAPWGRLDVRSTVLRLMSAGVCLLGTMSVFADPCGMVPPVYIEGNVPLERIGLQKTFVFYKDGIETFVIRPGFQGKVAEFGMLIPFPSPPALRKVADDTFSHIAAAVDPPEVVVDLTPILYKYRSPPAGSMATDMRLPEKSLEVSEVNVVKQEAVGMYEVAVLEAGSADALSAWMKDHGYRYPDGMDGVCEEYIEDQWCFVAVKARVGQKDGVDPKPGMKTTDSSLPPGAAFDGHVQGMGFRFRSDELVVPMRLSAFNEGDLHNVVYLLTDSPMKARDLPAGHVVRQVTGTDLLHNLTKPLPLRIIGGNYDDIPENRKQSLVVERDPTPHNGIAKDLFAGDLLTARTDKLTHEHEEMEKELLNIGERLRLRGAEIDRMHDEILQASRDKLTADAIADLQDMTLTVIDGDFDREVVAAENVYFTRFEINPARNTPQRYNARVFGPSEEGSATTVDADVISNAAAKTVAVHHPDHGRLLLQASEGGSPSQKWLIAAGLFVTAAFLYVLFIRRGGRTAAGLILLTLFLAEGAAQETGTTDEATVAAVLNEIEDTSDRNAAISQIKSLGDAAIEPLLKAARNDEAITRRGWAIICLKEIGGPKAANAFDSLIGDPGTPHIVQTWSAAARVDDITHFEDLERFARLCGQYPALRRPLRIKLLEITANKENTTDIESLLKLTLADYQLQQTLAPVLLKLKPAALSDVLVSSGNTDVRRHAASWLATQKTQGVQNVNQAVSAALAFDPDAEAPPWGTGPLFVPGVNWNKAEAIELVNELTAWYVWCVANDQQEQVSKIVTNLNTRQLMNAAGFHQVPGTVTQWLTVWEQVIGAEAMETLMKGTGFRYSPAKFERI